MRGRAPRPPIATEAPAAAAWRGGGVQLGGTIVWCDARRGREVVFLSHAHLDPRGALRGKLIVSPRTLALLEARGILGGAGTATALPVPMGRPLSLGALRLELFPSGHVPGAAQLLLVEPSGRRIVYAGDVNPRGLLGEPAEVRGADALVIEAPLAALPGALPPRREALDDLVARVQRAAEAGRTPVVLAPPLGVAQEAQRALAEAGMALRAHPAIRAWSQACARAGVTGLGSVLAPPLAGARGGGAALLWPLELARSRALGRIARPHRIALSGQALEARFADRVGAEEAVALADHADLPSLVEYVRHTGARTVYVTAGWGEPLARALADVGVEGRPLGPPRQMELGW